MANRLPALLQSIWIIIWLVSLIPGKSFAVVRIEINPADTRQTVSPLLWGGNIPGWDQEEGRLAPAIKKAIVDLGLTQLRFPAGLISDVYHWKDGIGKTRREKNSPELDRWFQHRKGLLNNRVGTDEFIKFCRELDAEPLITVNGATGTAEEAASWVEYCNGGENTQQGALRIANGFSQPYRVKYWEIGNELYGNWHKFHMGPKEYAEKFTTFSQAMKQKDAGIKVGAISGLKQKDLEWTRDILKAVGTQPDFIAFHVYYPIEAGRDLNRLDLAKGVMAIPALIERQLRDLKDDPLISRHNIQFAFTEFNTRYSKTAGPGLQDENCDLKSALSIAALYFAFIRQQVLLANIWSIFDQSQLSLIRTGPSGTTFSPTYYVLSFFAKEFGSLVVDSKTYDTPTIKFPNLLKRGTFLESGAVSCIATVNPDGSLLSLMVINMDMEQAHEATIKLQNFSPSPLATVSTLSGSSPYSLGPDEISIKTETRPLEQVSRLSLPPHSLTKIVWRNLPRNTRHANLH